MEPFYRGTAVVTGPKTERRGAALPIVLPANPHSTTPTGLTAAQPLHRLASPSWPLQHMFTSFVDAGGDPEIHGYLHTPAAGAEAIVVLTHGAGANCQSKLLVGMAEALAAIGFIVLRFDLPFRRARPYGPPFPATAARDRDGLRRAAMIMRKQTKGRVVLGGHSYGGRQASILAADDPQVADGLLLLSYPLHPPRKPEQLRTAHFPKLTTPAFFVHGTRDPFGSSSEMEAALKLIPGRHAMMEIEGAGHELLPKKSAGEPLNGVAAGFKTFLNL